jgi:hypothetical protein
MASTGFTDKSGPGGIVYTPASPYAQEMRKWEMGYSPYGQPGRPREQVGFQEYPARFYKAKRDQDSGKIVVEHELNAADEVEARNLQSRGYFQGQAAAYAALEEAEQRLAVAAAERAYSEQLMSEKAKAEAARFEATTAQHVAEIPETPILRRQPKEAR